MRLIYLDYAAAARPNRAALNLWKRLALDDFANPAALHARGRLSQQRLDNFRGQIGRLLSVKPEQLIFTAGATEANNLIISGCRANLAGGLACLATDHESIKAAADTIIDVDQVSGQADLNKLAKSTVELLSLAGVNHETGVRQDLKAVVAAVEKINKQRQAAKQPRLWLHVDGSQMATTARLYPAVWRVDLMTINGAKVGAPKQTGLIYRSRQLKWRPNWAGGGQESGWRPGTESVANAGALALSLTQAATGAGRLCRRLTQLRDDFEAGLKRIGGHIVLEKANRSPHISNCVFLGADGERLLFGLSRQNIMVGLGAACQAAESTPSTLTALGYDSDAARGSLRFSFGAKTTRSDLERTLNVLAKLMEANNR